MSINGKGFHPRDIVCLLCRLPPVPRTKIFDLSRAWCMVLDSDLTWYHSVCFDILKESYEQSDAPTYDDLRKLYRAIKLWETSINQSHVLDPHDLETTRAGLFSKHTKRFLQERFSQDLLGQLPVELFHMVVEFATPCWFLILFGITRQLMDLVLVAHGPCIERVEVRNEIWVSRVELRGVSYLTRISSKPLPPLTQTKQYRIGLPDQVKTIVLSTDFVGVRGIQFTTPNSEASPDGSPAYRIIDVNVPHYALEVEYNDIFVSGVKLVSGKLSEQGTAWTSLDIPKFNSWNVNQGRRGGMLEYIKIDSQLQGLLAPCADGRMISIHGFSGKTQKFKDLMYKISISGREVRWIYYPLSQNESIVAAWVRKKKGKRGKNADPILILQSSLGNIMTFGPQLSFEESQLYKYQPLVREADGAITGIFHDGQDPWSKDVLEVGVSCEKSSCATKRKSPLLELSNASLDTNTLQVGLFRQIPAPETHWYITYASLEGLSKIQLCRAGTGAGCSGALFFYHDGRVQAVGQILLDQEFTEERPTLLALGAAMDSVDLRSGVPDSQLRVNRRTGSWMRVPDRGILVWWFSTWGNRLSILDRGAE